MTEEDDRIKQVKDGPRMSFLEGLHSRSPVFKIEVTKTEEGFSYHAFRDTIMMFEINMVSAASEPRGDVMLDLEYLFKKLGAG